MSEKHKTRLICALTSTTASEMRAAMDTAALQGADAVECRLDYICPPPTVDDLARLLEQTPLETIVTCRPRCEGGHFQGDEAARLEILRAAARFAPTFIDVEMDTPRDGLGGCKLIVSYHDFDRLPDDLEQIIARQKASGAAVNKVAFAAAGPQDALRALDLVREADTDTLALAMGEAGLLSRILAGKFGAFGTFAAMDADSASAPGQPTLAEFKNLYRWDAIGPDTKVYGVVGCPVSHSMSPAIHNAAFAAAGYDGVYLPLRIEPGAENFNRFLDAALARPWFGLGGLSVTIPHKENALAYVGADNCDELAVRIGAINTVTIDTEGNLRGDNTDYAAAVDALCNAMDISREHLAGKAVAVLGAGGVARAIVAALAHYKAEVTIYNRTVERGRRLAGEFDCRAGGLDKLASMEAEIVINCTPIGMHPNVNASPLERIPPAARVVFDTIYNPLRTRLLHRGDQAGCLCVSGLEMFVNQAVAQFETWTGQAAPRATMKRVVAERLAAMEK